MHPEKKVSVAVTVFLRILTVFLMLLGYSCSSTKYVPDGKYLLVDNKVKIDKNKILDDEFQSYIKPKPNKRILGLKLYLILYNLSNKNKENWINRSLRTIGEEPVLYDEVQAEKTRLQLELYLKNKGYFDAIVKAVHDTTLKKEKEAKVLYEIDTNEPYRIGKISYSIQDPELADVVMPDSSQSKLKSGAVFDVDVISLERERIEILIQNAGFYRFSKEEHIFFEADSVDRIVNLKLILRNFREVDASGEVREIPHPRYRINAVYINTAYKPQDATTNKESDQSVMDTLEVEGFNIISPQKSIIKPNVVVSSTFVVPGDYYNKNNVNLTYRNLSSLSIFRLVNIEFVEIEGQEGETGRVINCNIQLTPFLLQSYTVEPEITNSSGNVGGGGSLNYQHRNLFMGAENFNFRIKGSLEAIQKTESRDIGNVLELGAEATLKIPKFLLPFKTDQFNKKYNPKTSFTLAYNFQRRPEYTRTVANMTFGYTWKGNSKLSHSLNPLELNFIQIPEMSDTFSNWLEGKYISYSYQPHMISDVSYTAIYSNQRIQSNRDFVYVKYYVEAAGNLMYSIYNITGQSKKDGAYELFSTPFAQYMRSDIDFRYYNILDENTSLVYRLFAGIGVPYKNSAALPFEKKYFSGGANSIRAWQVRDLGPGSFEEENESIFPNQTADIKLEANIEYRFKLFWIVKGAFFVDAGNIWALTSRDERPGAVFHADQFYKDIAVGTGFGARFDFSFFIFRLDMGIKVKDPVYPEGQKWVFANRNLERKDFVFNFGIGYPF